MKAVAQTNMAAALQEILDYQHPVSYATPPAQVLDAATSKLVGIINKPGHTFNQDWLLEVSSNLNYAPTLRQDAGMKAVAQTNMAAALQEILDYQHPVSYATPPDRVTGAARTKLQELSDAHSAIGRLGRATERNRGFQAYSSGKRAGKQPT